LERRRKLDKRYNIIYADPPWYYKKGVHDGVYQDGNRDIRSVVQHYPTMAKEELEQLPIKEIADKDCILFMWVTDSHLDQGIELIKKWGFKYKTIGFVWVKKTKNNKTCANVGAWTMKNTEICLIGTKGQMSKYKKSKNVYQLIEAERTEHSKKPDEARKRIEQIFGDISRVELFARQKTEGWDIWGNELENDLDLPIHIK
jgi:site-specific DNA-methyltransferase (adenine-specific)